MHATFVTLWLQVMQPLANVHETKWTPHVKRDASFFSGVRIRLGTILGRFSIIYFRGLGLRIRVRVWVGVRVSVVLWSG